jgi:hypothetical protein
MRLCEPYCGPRGRRVPSLPTKARPTKARPLNVCITSGQGSRTFSLSKPPIINNNLFLNGFPRNIAKMAGVEPRMSYSSMKGRLHDGLLRGLEVMGYE